MGMTFLLLLARSVGALFVFSGVNKLMSQPSFLTSLQALPFLPLWGARLIVAVLPWLEVVIGSLLVMGFLVSYATLASFTLLLAFSFVAVIAEVCGLDVPCACFGGSSRALLSWWTVGRNSLFALLLLPLVLLNRPSPLSIDAMLSGSVSRSLDEVVLVVAIPACIAGISILIAVAQRTLEKVNARH